MAQEVPYDPFSAIDDPFAGFALPTIEFDCGPVVPPPPQYKEMIDDMIKEAMEAK